MRLVLREGAHRDRRHPACAQRTGAVTRSHPARAQRTSAVTRRHSARAQRTRRQAAPPIHCFELVSGGSTCSPPIGRHRHANSAQRLTTRSRTCTAHEEAGSPAYTQLLSWYQVTALARHPSVVAVTRTQRKDSPPSRTRPAHEEAGSPAYTQPQRTRRQAAPHIHSL